MIKSSIEDILKNHLDFDNVILEKPKNKNFGHFATPVAFSLAKELRKAPKVIAEELSSKVTKLDIFKEVSAINGYINLKLSDSFLDSMSSQALKSPDSFAKSENKNEKILIEYVSANPTGPLHIGHARGAIYGDTLCNIGKHLGFDVKSEYYVNDAGNQIYLLGLSIFLAGNEHILNKDVSYPEEYYKGEYITDLALEAKKKFGIDIFTDEANIPTLSSWGKECMLQLIKENLLSLDISFDSYVSEKKLQDKWGVTYQKLQDSDATYEDDGKVWLKSTTYGDEKDRVIIREDKRPTYLAGDIIYHDDKYKREYDKYINIWGADHHGYISRVKASVDFLGNDSKKLEIVLAQMVSLLQNGETYKMSKRSGNFVLLSDVVDDIGSDALRFIFLTKKCDTHLEFDIDTLSNTDSSNPIFYINYAHARINQIFTKSGKNIEDVIDIKLDNINEETSNLLFFALNLEDTLLSAFNSRELQKLSEYLFNLASSLHKFYNSNMVVGSKNEDQILKVLAIVALSLRTGLKLMAIEAKYKM